MMRRARAHFVALAHRTSRQLDRATSDAGARARPRLGIEALAECAKSSRLTKRETEFRGGPPDSGARTLLRRDPGGLGVRCDAWCIACAGFVAKHRNREAPGSLFPRAGLHATATVSL